MTTIRRAVLAGIAGLTIGANAASGVAATSAAGTHAVPASVPARPEIYAPVTLNAD